jgi:hypothetical protein
MRSLGLLILIPATSLSLNAAIVTLPAVPVIAESPDPTAVGVTVGGLATVAVDPVNPGTASSGAYSARAVGGVEVELLPIFPLPPAASVILSTQTEITSSAINFNSHSDISGIVGQILSSTVILNNIIGAGLIPQWEASINLTSLGLNFDPSTDYSLTFNLVQSNSLLGNLSPAVLNQITASVGDSGGTLPAQVLGITDLFGSAGTVVLNFSTNATIDGPVVATFGGSALLTTGLLGSVLGTANNTLYSISNINVNPIPEPSSWALSAVFIGSFVLRRKRQAA